MLICRFFRQIKNVEPGSKLFVPLTVFRQEFLELLILKKISRRQKNMKKMPVCRVKTALVYSISSIEASVYFLRLYCFLSIQASA